MKYAILILFLCHVIGGQAQISKKSESAWIKTISVGINYSPEFCFRKLTNKANDDDLRGRVDRMIDFRNSIETPRMGSSFGLSVNYHFKQRFALESGISFSTVGFATQIFPIPSLTQDQIDANQGFINSTSELVGVTQFRVFDNYKYLELPLRLKHYHQLGDFQMFSSLGLTPAFLVKATIYSKETRIDGSTVRGKEHKQSQDYQKVNVFTTLGLGVNHVVMKNFRVQLEPTARLGVLTITDTNFSAYLWNFGLNLRLYYTLQELKT